MLRGVSNDLFLANNLPNFHIMEIFTCQNSKKLAKLFVGDYTSCSLANLWKDKFAIFFAI